MKEIRSIYLLKLICAFAVVLIHTQMAYKFYFMPMCRMAVPLFFIISGYFLVRGNGSLNPNKIKGILIRILQITIIVNIIYIVYYLLSGNFSTIIQYNKISWWIIEILTGWGICGHLWYLTAYLECLLCIYIISKFSSYTVLYLLTPLLLLLQLFIGSYSIFFNYTIPWNFAHTNFILTGLPCIALGMYIKTHEIYLKKLITNHVILLIIILAYIEGLLIISHVDYYSGVGDIFILTIPASVAIFIFCLKHPSIGSHIASYSKHTLNIYLYHNLIKYLFATFATFNYYKFEAPIIFFLTLILSLFYYYLKKKLICLNPQI